MARKFKVGDIVRISTPDVPDSDFNGAEGIIVENIAGGHLIEVNGLGEHFASPRNLELIVRNGPEPMTSRPSYIAGVAKANEERIARERLAADCLQAFEAWGVSALARTLNSAKAHRDENRAKYASQAKMTVKFTPVAKGSEPIRVNPVVGLSRRSFRHLRRNGWTTDRIARLFEDATKGVE
jgi:hypothetical protein